MKVPMIKPSGDWKPGQVTDEYRDGWNRIFGKEEKADGETKTVQRGHGQDESGT